MFDNVKYFTQLTISIVIDLKKNEKFTTNVIELVAKQWI